MNKDRIWFYYQLIAAVRHAYGSTPLPNLNSFLPAPVPPGSMNELFLSVATMTEEQALAFYHAERADMMDWKIRVSARSVSGIDPSSLNITI